MHFQWVALQNKCYLITYPTYPYYILYIGSIYSVVFSWGFISLSDFFLIVFLFTVSHNSACPAHKETRGPHVWGLRVGQWVHGRWGLHVRSYAVDFFFRNLTIFRIILALFKEYKHFMAVSLFCFLFKQTTHCFFFA